MQWESHTLKNEDFKYAWIGHWLHVGSRSSYVIGLGNLFPFLWLVMLWKWVPKNRRLGIQWISPELTAVEVGVRVLKGLVGLHRTVQLQLLQHYWLGHRLGSVWYWMVCLGNRDHSVMFEIEIVVLVSLVLVLYLQCPSWYQAFYLVFNSLPELTFLQWFLITIQTVWPWSKSSPMI